MNISEINQNATISTDNVVTNNISVLVGSIVFLSYNQGTIPGYLVCDGSFVSKTTYTNLFNFLNSHNTNYPQTTTDFQLPDLRGTFIRNAPFGGGNDPDGGSNRALNTVQQYALKQIWGRQGVYQCDYSRKGSAYGVFWRDQSTGGTDGGGGGDACGWSYTDTSYSVASNDYECRPNNRAMLACIKY